MCLTFRADKNRRIQESSKSSRNALKLASRLQRFLVTGKISKKDLEAIDAHYSTLLLGQGKHVFEMLEQLVEHVPRSKGRESLEGACESWRKWVSIIEGGGYLGYSGAFPQRNEFKSALIEEVIDLDTDLSRMIMVFNESLTSTLRKSSYELPDVEEIGETVQEILEIYSTRERTLRKIAPPEPVQAAKSS